MSGRLSSEALSDTSSSSTFTLPLIFTTVSVASTVETISYAVFCLKKKESAPHPMPRRRHHVPPLVPTLTPPATRPPPPPRPPPSIPSAPLPPPPPPPP